ncbi:ubiquinone biosynthesis O-methyltransferase, mitochondrial-like [Planococcus citri]|uniref:ubiquinone biosynthesis O-methyltransferase, mitochondrial-like n=1 Tax=Planococcus citri TaxID=170843 RepID=UPI0031F9E873
MEFTRHTTVLRRLAFRIKAKGNMDLHTQSIAMQKETEKQQKVNMAWWNGCSLTLFNTVRVPFIRDGIHKTGIKNNTATVDKTRLDGVKVLDVGCGGGILCEELARLGADVNGLDVDAEALDTAKHHQLLDDSIRDNLNYINDSIYEHERDNFEKYDAVIISEVIEHVPNTEKEKFLSSSINALRPGGSLFITCPNRTISSRIIVIFLFELIGMIPKGTHYYDDFITPESLIKMIEKNKCESKNVIGIFYNPFKKDYVISWYKSLFYGIHAIKMKEK